MRKNALILDSNSFISGYFEGIYEFFEKSFSKQELNQLAKEHNFIQRNGKIDAFKFVTALIFNEIEQSKLSLLDLKLDLLNHYDCDVSREAIHKRFNPNAVNFLKAFLAKLLSVKLSVVPSQLILAKAFSRICVKDSTKFTIPAELADSYPGYGGFNNKSGLMNIQYEYDLLSGDWISLDLTKATRNDQQDSKESLDKIEKNDLHLRDLGYVTMTYLLGISDRKAYFLNRLPTSINTYYYKKGEWLLINWRDINKKMKKCNLKQMELDVLLSKKYKLKARMVIQPIPEDVYAERIRKATKRAKSQGCQLTAEYKIKARYNIFITNIPVDLLTGTDVVQTYRLRWQIELVFKAWKSTLSVNHVKRVKKDRFECQLIAKLIWTLINWKLFQTVNLAMKKINPESGLSIFKYYKQAIKYSPTLRLLIGKKDKLRRWLIEIFIPVVPHLMIETKKGKVSHCLILSNLLQGLS